MTFRQHHRDNIATKHHKVWRLRIITPLTIRAIREQQLTDDGTLIRTPLDALCSDAIADALELYAACEALLSGNARCTDYVGDRVQSTRRDLTPLADRHMAALRHHAAIKRRLPRRTLAILAAWCLQQWRHESALSDAQLGLIVAPSASNAARAWQEAVAEAGKRLVR